MVSSILSNIAIILLMHLSINYYYDFKHRLTKNLDDSIFVVIASTAVISMLFLPISYNDGFIFDLRLVPLTFIALVKGPRITIYILVIVSLFRLLVIGGSGVIPGLFFGTWLPTLFALLFSTGEEREFRYLKIWLVISGVWVLSDIPIIWFHPNGWEVFQSIALLRYISFVGGAFLLYTFIVNEHKRTFMRDQLKFYAEHDPLTGAYNRRKFLDIMKNKSVDQQSYVAIIDIDYFKKINDTYGHITGDKILVEITEIISKRDKDQVIVGRYGGEEFILFIYSHSSQEVAEILDSIREEICNHQFYSFSSEKLPTITVSIGISRLNDPEFLLEDINRADFNLYKAKEKGRNRILFAEPNNNDQIESSKIEKVTQLTNS